MPDRRELLHVIIIDNQNNNGRVTGQLSHRLSAGSSRQDAITSTCRIMVRQRTQYWFHTLINHAKYAIIAYDIKLQNNVFEIVYKRKCGNIDSAYKLKTLFYTWYAFSKYKVQF